MKIGLVNRENPVIAHILDKGRENNDSRRTYSSKNSEYCSNIKFLSEIFFLLRVDDQWQETNQQDFNETPYSPMQFIQK